MKKGLLPIFLIIVVLFACTTCSGEDIEQVKNRFNTSKITKDDSILSGTTMLTEDTIFASSKTICGGVLDLNGYTLTLYNTLHIENGSIIKNGTIKMTGDKCTAISANGTPSIIDNVQITVIADYSATAIQSSYGVSIKDSTITVRAISENESTRSIGILGLLCGDIMVDNTTILAETTYGEAYAIDAQALCTVKNSNLQAYANYDSNSSQYKSLSIGVRSQGQLFIENSYIYGVHSGVNSFGDTTINGGTYSGYGHGGLYCSGPKSTYYIYNATIKEADLPTGYQSLSTLSTHNGMYIGGNSSQNNITVYMDNCIVTGTKHAIVLRGSSGEENHRLYISNSTVDKTSIRIDNDTHKLYIGQNCNFTAENTTKPETVFITNEIYKGR